MMNIIGNPLRQLTVKLDGDGNPVFDDDGNLVYSDSKPACDTATGKPIWSGKLHVTKEDRVCGTCGQEVDEAYAPVVGVDIRPTGASVVDVPTEGHFLRDEFENGLSPVVEFHVPDPTIYYLQVSGSFEAEEQKRGDDQWRKLDNVATAQNTLYASGPLYGAGPLYVAKGAGSAPDVPTDPWPLVSPGYWKVLVDPYDPNVELGQSPNNVDGMTLWYDFTLAGDEIDGHVTAICTRVELEQSDIDPDQWSMRTVDIGYYRTWADDPPDDPMPPLTYQFSVGTSPYSSTVNNLDFPGAPQKFSTDPLP